MTNDDLDLIVGGKTKVYGSGRVQIPVDVKKDLKIKDGDYIIWLKNPKDNKWFIKAQRPISI